MCIVKNDLSDYFFIDIINTTLMNTNYDVEIHYLRENKHALMYQSLKTLCEKIINIKE